MKGNETRPNRSIATFEPTIRVPAYILDEARERHEMNEQGTPFSEILMDHMEDWEYVRKPTVPVTCDDCGRRWSFAGVEAESICPDCGKPNPV